MKPSRKRIFLFMITSTSVVLFFLIFHYVKHDQLSFERYVKQFTKEQLENNALDLHYTLSYPDVYGIKIKSPLPSYQKEEALTSYKNIQKQMEEFEKIDPSALSEEDAFTYWILADYLKESMEIAKFPYYQEPLTVHSGIHTTLPILLAEYTFYSEDDIENYLSILDSVPNYLASLLLYEEEKANAGLFMSQTALSEVVSACIQFADCENVSNHLLCTSFEERLSALSEGTNSLSEEDKTMYCLKNEQLVSGKIIPAYFSMAKELSKLSSFCNKNYTGLCTYENGKEYYLALIKRNSGCNKSIQNIKEMLYTDFETSYTTLISLLSENTFLLEDDYLTEFDTSFPITDANEILNQLSTIIKKDFPSLSVTPKITVKNVAKSLENYSAPAFYLTVPMDNYIENVIYLNPSNTLSNLSLYTTLAHEGFPGHLYQTVYFHTQNDTVSKDYNYLLRNILYYGGYTEGYALYTEALSYDYAASLYSEYGISNAEIVCNTLKNEWQMQLSLYCLLDIAIHYDGASYEQIKSLLNQFGVSNSETVDNIYEYLLSEPTAYLKYYLGYLEIKNLKQLAINLWDNDYSDFTFHQFLLETGPCNFYRLEDRLINE